MFVEGRRVKEGKKYYLVHAYRVSSGPRKISIYLGLNLSGPEIASKMDSARIRIEEKLKLLKTVRDPYQTVLSSSELEELRSMLPSGRIKHQHLSEPEWLKFTELFTYDTNAIEGSTVDKSEVQNILERNEWPDKSKEEISETFGVAEAVDYIRNTKEHISIKLILKLHSIVFRNSKPFSGKLRKSGEEVVIMDSARNIVHRGAPATIVLTLLNALVKWYKKNRKAYPPLVLAAVVHNQFENIHPFRDGNGRAGRLLLLNILLKNGLPPVNIELKNRSRYYAALQSYEKEGNIRPTVELLLMEYRRLKSVLKR